MVPQSARKTSSASASAASPVLVWNQLSLDVLSRSADVKVCGWRPHDGGAAHTGAGVRKPPREETAGGVERPRVRRYRDFGVGGVWSRFADRRFGTRSRGGRIQPVGWVELFAKPIIFAATLDGYRFAPPILATS